MQVEKKIVHGKVNPSANLHATPAYYFLCLTASNLNWKTFSIGTASLEFCPSLHWVGRGVGVAYYVYELEFSFEVWRVELSSLPSPGADALGTDAHPTDLMAVREAAVCTLVTKSGRNLQLRLRDGDLPLEGGLRLAFCVRLHLRLTRVAVVQGPI